jgi:hypothetical protein
VPSDVPACADLRGYFDAYAYLLGIYLGNGYLIQAPRNVWRLRIFQDKKYPAIIERIEWAIEAVACRRPGRVSRTGCFEIYTNWKHWRCLFPQHGRGLKHLRPIRLEPWQDAVVAAYPAEFVRGLVHSDGCRAVNRVVRSWAETTRAYEYTRYFFSNTSSDIRALFIAACALLAVEAIPNNRTSISVARAKSVEILDSIIGPKQ